MAAFNTAAYWDCHNILEPLWLAEPSPARDFYKGLIQVAGGLYHVDRGNRAGACSLLAKGPGYLAPFVPACQGLDVQDCRTRAAAVLAFVHRTPAPGALPRLPPRLRPTWRWSAP
ncbi:DUF309 domain-containing protein [Megalodesulfovibrio paquesii]